MIHTAFIGLPGLAGAGGCPLVLCSACCSSPSALFWGTSVLGCNPLLLPGWVSIQLC